MAADASNANEVVNSQIAATCRVVLRSLQGETRELTGVPLRETFSAFCRRVREATGAIRQGHAVQLMHGARVLRERGSTPLISVDVFNAFGPDIELTYLVQEVLMDMEQLIMAGMTGLERRPPPRFDQALFDRQRRSEEWAKEAQTARERRLDQLVVAVPEELSDAHPLCIGSRPRLEGEVADATWDRYQGRVFCGTEAQTLGNV
ncbi:Ank2 [Symbiodinium pilosum]|uniref:Ank2 protein n=1 Tax=Symbiodinium pilosum TaxID=2952 RepID=A0A812ITH0_SYMPI|nr:Ank2 [Symbiodinium pilosum]